MTLLPYLVTLLLSILLTLLMVKIAHKRAILDHPNERSSHAVPTPRGGGLAVVLSFYTALLFFAWGFSDFRIVTALLAGIPLAAVGFLDDLFDLSAAIRFAVQVCCAAIALWFLEVPIIYWLPALMMVVWFTNLFNFLDGIDGYLSVELLFLSLSGLWFFRDPLLLFLGAAVIGFLPFNWQRASIFMGDVGSTTLGFIVAVFILYDSHTPHDYLVWFLLTMPFWFDATYTLVRRFANGEKITQAHRKHLFQRAVRSGFSHQQVTLGLLALDISLFGLILMWEQHIWMVFCISLLVVLAIVYLIEKRMAFHEA